MSRIHNFLNWNLKHGLYKMWAAEMVLAFLEECMVLFNDALFVHGTTSLLIFVLIPNW